MVIKGSARGGAGSLAAHLQRTDTNERAEVRELRGVVAEDLDGALSEIEAVASGARSQRPFYHASINTRADEVLTPEQWLKAIDRLEQELDLTGQPRVVVTHLKEGRAHVHVAWSRIDLETMKAIPDSHNYRRHEIVARELEREFGHARVQGAHIERGGEPRPDRTPTHAEMQQAERTSLTPEQAKAQLTEIWNRTDSGKAFAAAIAEAGWTLARGDKRDFVVLDPDGETHSLARRIDGAKAKDIRTRMADVDAGNLPSVGDARAQQEDRQVAKAQDLQVRADPTPQPAAASQRTEAVAVHIDPPAVTAGAPAPRNPAKDEDTEPLRPAVAAMSGGMVAQQREANRLFVRHQATTEAHSDGPAPLRATAVVGGDDAAARDTRPQSAAEFARHVAHSDEGSSPALDADSPTQEPAAGRSADRAEVTITSDEQLNRAEALAAALEQRQANMRGGGSLEKAEKQQESGNQLEIDV